MKPGQTRFRLLEALEEAKGGFISGQQLSRRLSVSRTCIWKHVRALRSQGYEVHSQSNRGYRLVSCPDAPTPLEVRKKLRCRLLGRELRYLGRVGSTQDEAFKLAQKGAPEGTVVLAEEQSGGRGRVGRSFFSPKGGLWFSFILRPPLQPQVCLPVSLMAGVAVSEAVRAVTGLPAVLKWPNDVLIGGKKVAGILAEIVAETDAVRFVVCGIGVNANISAGKFPAELRPIATSLRIESGREVSLLELLCRILERLDFHYQEFLSRGPKAVLDAWRACPNVLGGRVRVTAVDEVVEGTAQDIDSDGALLVRTEEGVKRVIVGDVALGDK